MPREVITLITQMSDDVRRAAGAGLRKYRRAAAAELSRYRRFRNANGFDPAAAILFVRFGADAEAFVASPDGASATSIEPKRVSDLEAWMREFGRQALSRLAAWAKKAGRSAVGTLVAWAKKVASLRAVAAALRHVIHVAWPGPLELLSTYHARLERERLAATQGRPPGHVDLRPRRAQPSLDSALPVAVEIFRCMLEHESIRGVILNRQKGLIWRLLEWHDKALADAAAERPPKPHVRTVADATSSTSGNRSRTARRGPHDDVAAEPGDFRSTCGTAGRPRRDRDAEAIRQRRRVDAAVDAAIVGLLEQITVADLVGMLSSSPVLPMHVALDRAVAMLAPSREDPAERPVRSQATRTPNELVERLVASLGRYFVKCALADCGHATTSDAVLEAWTEAVIASSVSGATLDQAVDRLTGQLLALGFVLRSRRPRRLRSVA